MQTNGITAGNATGQVVFSSAQRPVQHQHGERRQRHQFSITNLPEGTDLITAIYSGGNYPGSTNTLDQIVSAPSARGLRKPIFRFTPTIW